MTIAGVDNNRGLRILCFGLLQNSETICLIHIEIGYYQIKVFLAQHFNSGLATCFHRDLIALIVKYLTNHSDDVRIVIYQKYFVFTHCLAPRSESHFGKGII